MTIKELKLLNALYNLIEIAPELLNNKACNKYNELADKANTENLIW